MGAPPPPTTPQGGTVCQLQAQNSLDSDSDSDSAQVKVKVTLRLTDRQLLFCRCGAPSLTRGRFCHLHVGMLHILVCSQLPRVRIVSARSHRERRFHQFFYCCMTSLLTRIAYITPGHVLLQCCSLAMAVSAGFTVPSFSRYAKTLT
jgi:hypothetical protein